MSRDSRRAEIAALLALRDREGLTYEELSERCGLAAATLSWWSWRLRREAREQPAFVEVDVMSDSVDSGDISPRMSRVTVRRGDWQVDVSGIVDRDQVRAVLEVLVELPC